jgi:hypothetical protein
MPIRGIFLTKEIEKEEEVYNEVFSSNKLCSARFMSDVSETILIFNIGP